MTLNHFSNVSINSGNCFSGIEGDLIAGVSLALALLSIESIGLIFGYMKWPIYHSWGLAHGRALFLVAFVYSNKEKPGKKTG